MQEGKLTREWNRAMASLPVGWRLLGVIHRSAPGADQFWSPTDDEWAAVAQPLAGAGAESALTVGYGSHPEQALRALADEVRPLRQDPNG